MRAHFHFFSSKFARYLTIFDAYSNFSFLFCLKDIQIFISNSNVIAIGELNNTYISIWSFSDANAQLICQNPYVSILTSDERLALPLNFDLSFRNLILSAVEELYPLLFHLYTLKWIDYHSIIVAFDDLPALNSALQSWAAEQMAIFET